MGANYLCSRKHSLSPQKPSPAGESILREQLQGAECNFPRGFHLAWGHNAPLPTGIAGAQAVTLSGTLLSSRGAAPGRPPRARDPERWRGQPPASPLEGATNPAWEPAPAPASPVPGELRGAASRGQGSGSSQPHPLHLSPGVKGLCWGGGNSSAYLLCGGPTHTAGTRRGGQGVE